MTPYKILIVEDERITAEAIKKLVQKVGYDVTAIVASGKDAIKAVETDEPDLILMDIKLRGGMDGIEAASQIRKRFGMPVIYLTAYSDKSVLERAKITGPYGYLVKPVFERDLHSNIEMAIYKSRMDHRIERLSIVLDTIRSINQLIIRETDQDRLIQEICHILIKTRGYQSGYLVLLDKSGKYITHAQAGLDEHFKPIAQLLQQGRLPACGREAISGSEVLVVDETTDICADCPVKDQWKGRVKVECCGNRFLAHRLAFQNTIYGFMVVNLSARIAFDVAELSLYREVADDIGFALRSAESEEKRKSAEQELKDVNHRLAMLLASLPIVPYTCEAHGGFELTYINTSIEEMTGYKPEDFTENPSFWAEQIAPEDRKRVFADLSVFTVHGKYFGEYRFKIADGSYRWLRDMRGIARTPDGKISHIAGIWYDITEEKRVRQESENRLKQVIHSDKLASLGKVVAGVAHEINNPNSFIAYNIPLLEETWQLFEPILVEYAEKHPQWRAVNMTMDELFQDMREIIQAIKTGSERINKVVLDLKDFIRPDNSYNLNPVQVNGVIDKALTIVGAQIRQSVAKLEIKLADHLPDIQGWFQRLEQVVVNLVVNAIQSISSKDKGRLSITTRYLERIKSVLIQVEDNGIGMAPEVSERIFEPFFTTRRDAGGTGLGLSISYDLIKEHHGTFGVLSRPGRGTRFTVFLPVGTDPLLNLRPIVLHVDTDEQFSKLLRSYFIDSENISIKNCATPQNVIKQLELYPEVDIVLSNIEILRMNGWELLRQIKEQFPLIQLILYSDVPGESERQNVSLPIPDHQLEILHKPFEMEQLGKMINTIERQRL
jgi:PAS domain S-box-containing protein